MNVMKEVEEFYTHSKEIYFDDLYLLNIPPVSGTRQAKHEEYLNDTLTQYHMMRPSSDEFLSKKRSVKKELIKLLDADHIVVMNGKPIFREMYKIFALIDTYLSANEILKSPDYGKFGLVSFETGESLSSQKEKDKSYLCNPHITVNEPGEYRLRWHLAEYIGRDKLLAKFFLHMIILQDMEKYAFLYEDRAKTKKVFNILSPYLLQQTTTDQLVKSFSILLYFELIRYLNVSKTRASEITREITFTLFNQTANHDTFNKYIWLKSSIYDVPIFGSSATEYLRDERKDFVQNTIKKTVVKEFGFEFSDEFMECSMNSLSRSSHIQYLMKYPREFFVKNPKYSYLDSDQLGLNYWC